jgi:trehalose 6-phosphate synthase/phosphatase
LYTSSDVALLTPIRDGMNLVAKEYVASRFDRKGVLILSEMAGAAKEMSEAIVINPNNYEEIADSLKEALTMPEEEQIERNIVMQDRLKRYNIEKWANDFFNDLENIHHIRDKYVSKKITDVIQKNILTEYAKAEKRVLFLDYDGTLVGFQNKPEDAKPDKELIKILDKLCANPKNKLVLISGRDRDTFDEWFKGKPYTFIVEHGVWFKDNTNEWEVIEQMNIDWKETIRPIIELYIDRTPGTFIEEKNYSLVWHYRKADPELGLMRANELKDELTSFVANHNLEIMEGNKVIEIKNSGVNKGRAANKFLINKHFDFIFGIGDDWTDEYLFEELPEIATTVKVGLKNTSAKYNLETPKEVRKLLGLLAEK